MDGGVEEKEFGNNFVGLVERMGWDPKMEKVVIKVECCARVNLYWEWG